MELELSFSTNVKSQTQSTKTKGRHMRHVLTLDDLTTEETRRVLEIAFDLKTRLAAGERPPLFERNVLGLLFEKPSLRTRVSFETLANQLGGASLFLGEDVGFGSREPLCDFMPILTSYIDVLVIRAKSHAVVQDAVSYSRCPVINGLTDVSHPCQAFADIMTVQELCDGKLDDVKIAYLGDGNNVAYSLALMCSKLGVKLTIGAPAKYQFEQSLVDGLNQAAGKTVIEQTEDPVAAASCANFLYTDVWTSMGQESENEQRISDLKGYQINAKLMQQAAEGALLLHCLPARRGEEVTSQVIDSPQSAVIQQAENRLHAQKGLMVWLLNESNRA
jgi:ornithine carbamoyltransferase